MIENIGYDVRDQYILCKKKIAKTEKLYFDIKLFIYFNINAFNAIEH